MSTPELIDNTNKEDPLVSDSLVQDRPSFKHWKVRGAKDRKVGKADEAKLKELEALRGADRYQQMAEYILEQCRIIRPEEETEKLLVDANSRSATTGKPEKTAKEIERHIEQDRGTQLVLEILPEAAVMAALYQQAENYSRRQAMLEATADYDRILPIRRINQLYRRSLMGPADHRGVGDTIRIVVANIEGHEKMPESPTPLNIVE